MASEYVTKNVLAWALYDWANSAFATTIMAGFFPVFFKQYWSTGLDVTASTFQLGAANSLASVIIAVCAPILGAIADRGSTRKKFLGCFAALGIVMTGGLYFVARGDWQIAVALYVLALIGFSGGNIFYDALIVSVAGDERRDVVSALGFAVGYLGGGLLFALNVIMTLTPQTFGLPDTATAVRVAFVSVAVWWAVFSLPLFFLVEEPPTRQPCSGWTAVRAGCQQLHTTLRAVRQLRVVGLFLLGYWLYIDGVDTIVRMAVDYGMSLGLQAKSLMVALLITQFVGFPAAIGFGKIGEKLGAKTGIFIGIGVYVGVTVWGAFLHSEAEFYALAIAIGCVQGGVQSLSRSLYSRLIPAREAAEFFGFYNMVGKCAAIIGPALMGWTGVLTGNPRYAIVALVILFVSGAILLYGVDEAAAQPGAKEPA
jgi:UMF1 family MFS transporter